MNNFWSEIRTPNTCLIEIVPKIYQLLAFFQFFIYFVSEDLSPSERILIS